jgi:hypothetical protein
LAGVSPSGVLAITLLPKPTALINSTNPAVERVLNNLFIVVLLINPFSVISHYREPLISIGELYRHGIS